MAAITADIVSKVDETPKAKTGGKPDLVLAVYLAAGRFGSPAGVAFLPQNYLPFLTRK